MPEDLSVALAANPEAPAQVFDGFRAVASLRISRVDHRSAKRPETRAKRIGEASTCWPRANVATGSMNARLDSLARLSTWRDS